MLYSDHTGQGVTCSFAATCDVMNVQSSSVNKQFGETCLVFPRLICRSPPSAGFIYNSLYILRCLNANVPVLRSAWQKTMGTKGDKGHYWSSDQWGHKNPSGKSTATTASCGRLTLSFVGWHCALG